MTKKPRTFISDHQLRTLVQKKEHEHFGKLLTVGVEMYNSTDTWTVFVEVEGDNYQGKTKHYLTTSRGGMRVFKTTDIARKRIRSLNYIGDIIMREEPNEYGDSGIKTETYNVEKSEIRRAIEELYGEDYEPLTYHSYKQEVEMPAILAMEAQMVIDKRKKQFALLTQDEQKYFANRFQEVVDLLGHRPKLTDDVCMVDADGELINIMKGYVPKLSEIETTEGDSDLC